MHSKIQNIQCNDITGRISVQLLYVRLGSKENFWDLLEQNFFTAHMQNQQ